MRHLIFRIAIVFAVLLAAPCLFAQEQTSTEATTDAAPVDAAASTHPRVVLETSKGSIVVELFEDKAPKTVANFLVYVKEGFYNGTVFHRVIPHFMIQGGGFTPDMVKKATHDPVENEASNGLRNERGTVAMARLMDPHSATAQFFINVVNSPSLDHRGGNDPRSWGYTVFAKVVEGMDVVDTIRVVATGMTSTPEGVPLRDVPIEPVVIERVYVEGSAE